MPTLPNLPEYIDLTQPNLRQLYVRSLRDGSSCLISIPGVFIEHLKFSLNTDSEIGYGSRARIRNYNPLIYKQILNVIHLFQRQTL